MFIKPPLYARINDTLENKNNPESKRSFKVINIESKKYILDTNYY